MLIEELFASRPFHDVSPETKPYAVPLGTHSDSELSFNLLEDRGLYVAGSSGLGKSYLLRSMQSHNQRAKIPYYPIYARITDSDEIIRRLATFLDVGTKNALSPRPKEFMAMVYVHDAYCMNETATQMVNALITAKDFGFNAVFTSREDTPLSDHCSKRLAFLGPTGRNHPEMLESLYQGNFDRAKVSDFEESGINTPGLFFDGFKIWQAYLFQR